VIARAALAAAVGALALSAAVGAAPQRPLQLVAIGDSLPYGQYDCGNCATFVDLFGRALARATGRQVEVHNLSEHTGIDSRDLRRQLASSANLRREVAGADAITVTIGHNDPPWNSSHDPCDGKGGYPDADWSVYDGSCLAKMAPVFEANLDAILHTIRALRHGKPTLLRVTDDYDDLIGDPKFDTAAAPLVKRFFDRYSAIACRLAQRYAGICIDTYHAFNGPNGTRGAGPLLGPDHTHPNPAGHRLIAGLLERAGYWPLRR
jgi:lysophospholipase L1-like esterase